MPVRERTVAKWFVEEGIRGWQRTGVLPETRDPFRMTGGAAYNVG